MASMEGKWMDLLTIRDMNYSKPLPISDLEANFENSLSNISGCIPVPVSFTRTIILSVSLLLVFFVIEIYTMPSLVNLMADYQELDLS